MIAKPYQSLFESDVIVDADFGVGTVVGSSLKFLGKNVFSRRSYNVVCFTRRPHIGLKYA